MCDVLRLLHTTAYADVRCFDNRRQPCAAGVLPEQRVQLSDMPPWGGQLQWTMMASDGVHVATHECRVTVSCDVPAMALATWEAVRVHVQHAAWAGWAAIRATLMR